MTGVGRRAGGWLVALGLVAVASIAVATAPQPGTIADPFPVTGKQGEVVHARQLDAEVTGVRLAESLDIAYDESGLDTAGVWVIVDAAVTTNLAVASLALVELHIDGVSYRATEMPNPSMDFLSYGAGIRVKGPIVFEVPVAALDGDGLEDALVVFQTGVDMQLDSLPVVTIDLRGLDVARTEIIDPAVVIGAP